MTNKEILIGHSALRLYEQKEYLFQGGKRHGIYKRNHVLGKRYLFVKMQLDGCKLVARK